jgi:hypothetical protein
MRKTTMQQHYHHNNHSNNNNSLHHLQVPARYNNNRMPIQTKCDDEIDNTDLCYLKAMKTTIGEIGQASTSNM